MTEPWWTKIDGSSLAQGDLLDRCLMPMFTGDFSSTDDKAVEETLVESRLIVLTQSCDLENAKVEVVALCPVYTLLEFSKTNPKINQRDYKEEIRKGKMAGLHMLASPEKPQNNEDVLLADFGHITSLPFHYLASHANSLGKRWRLQSPFLEHFSQAFARFFMRVGLPSNIPPFK